MDASARDLVKARAIDHGAAVTLRRVASVSWTGFFEPPSCRMGNGLAPIMVAERIPPRWSIGNDLSSFFDQTWDAHDRCNASSLGGRSDHRSRRVAMKVRELVRLLEKEGWRQVRQRGSHRQFQHPIKPGTVTVSGKLGVEIPQGTLRSALKQAGVK
jgi:predicted RNA binding protein YcfA (HicA-like mRNA interferase family)